MDEKDPSPFGYTFTGDFFGGSPTAFDNAGPSLLNELESQSLEQFFTNTSHWPSEAPPEAPLPPTTEAKDTHDEMNNWSLFPPPATIHSVSTTVPDQAQLHGFPTDESFGTQHPGSHFGHTPDDLQAASTLFSNAHMAAQTNGRAYSLHGLPNTMPGMSAASNGMLAASAPPNGQPMTGFHSMPTVPTPHAHINEQLATLIPHHELPGTVDAELATQWANSNARQRHQAEFQELGLQRPPLKRAYTYGTDSSFNESGFHVSSKHETEEYVTKRVMRDLHHAHSLARQTSASGDGAQLLSPTGHFHFPANLVDIPSDGERQSDEESSDDDGENEKPSKKKRKSKASPTKNGKAPGGSRGGGKNRKASVDDRVSKKKRGSVAGQKTHRENLSEEQKRSNHILSEQKRRNLIKRGFDDLHDLVPEIRNGGLSKSAVLTEAANFLDDLIADNKHYLELIGGPEG